MSFRSIYDLAKVQTVIDGAPFGEQIFPARLTLLGTTQGQVQVKLYGAGLIDEDDPDSGMRWVEADYLPDAKVSLNEASGRLVITGTSTAMVNDQMLRPEQAQVRYDVEPKECEGCR